jgi:hypothetical protein
MDSVCLLFYFLAFWAPSNQSLFSLLPSSFCFSSLIISQSISKLLSLIPLRALHKNSHSFEKWTFQNFHLCAVRSPIGQEVRVSEFPFLEGSVLKERNPLDNSFLCVFEPIGMFSRDFSFILRQVTMGSWILCSWEWKPNQVPKNEELYPKLLITKI